MPQVRETQRIPRSCIPCARRKVKCSKKIPCEQCVQRGDVVACIREVVKVGGKITVAVDAEGRDNASNMSLLRENASLRTRIKQLELALAVPELRKLDTGISQPTSAAPELQSSQKIMNDFQTQAFGLFLDSPGHVEHRAWNNSAKVILPTRQWSEVIVAFSLVQLGWVHCAVDEASFMEEHDAFWEKLVEYEKECLENHSWMAVYLSILAVGIYFIDEEEIHGIQLLCESFSTQSSLGSDKSPAALCRTWYDAALKELYLSDYTRKPALSTVQAVAILNVVHKNLGEPSREYILHGMAVNIARLIGIDHLGEEIPTMPISNRAQRTIQRRLWWTLVICDWMTVSSRPISIHPHSFTTILEDEENQNNSPSPFEYHKVMARIAAMIRIHVSSTKEWSSGALKAIFEELDIVCASFPPHLRDTESINDSIYDLHDPSNEPYWNTLQRHLALNCVDSWRISLYVATMPQILNDPEPKYKTLHDGILTAKRILHRRYNDPNLQFHKFWSVNSAVVSAGIFLALDLICFQQYRPTAQVTEQKDLVALSSRMLEQSSGQARHGGLLVLRRLTHLYETMLPSFSYEVNSSALARIVRLVAVPHLWDFLPDAEATIRFIFLDTQALSDQDGNSQSGSSSSLDSSAAYMPPPGHSSDTLHGEPFEAWKQFMMDGEDESVPYLGQLLPAAGLVDSSLAFDPTLFSGPLRCLS